MIIKFKNPQKDARKKNKQTKTNKKNKKTGFIVEIIQKNFFLNEMES